MFVVVWEFEPHVARLAEFEEMYGASGVWTRLFSNSRGYLGTELLRDAAGNGRYLTIDRWASSEVFEQFLADNRTEYDRLDSECEALTKRESLIGRFHFP